MIVNLKMGPNEPCFQGFSENDLKEVTKRGKKTFCFKAEMNQENADLIRQNIEKMLNNNIASSDEKFLLTGSVPTWIHLIAVNVIRNKFPLSTAIEYKKGKHKITLPIVP